jgi:hypothetical protein
MLPKQPHPAGDRRIREGDREGRKFRYRADRLVVKLRVPTPKPTEAAGAAGREPSPRIDAATLEAGLADVARVIPTARLVRAPSGSGRLVFSLETGADSAEVAARVAQLERVEYAEPDVVDSVALVPSDTRYVDQWALPKVNAPAAWDVETGSPSVLIGIIDSGISMAATGGLDHPDLDDASRYIMGTDFVDGGDPRDLHGHGTHVAGIAGAESNNGQGVSGMDWGTPVYVCRTIPATGGGSAADFADAVEEIVDYAVAHNLKAVINYSAGGGASQTKQDACKYVNDHGMLLCAAAGNDFAGPVIFPAAYSTMFDGVIAVGSTNDDDTVSDFSNVGPEVTVVAPGRDILSTTPTYAVTLTVALNYDELSGTSMATPLVTGLVALMWSRHAAFTNLQIRNCLTSTAVKLGAGNFDNSWGFGRVDASAAVRCGDRPFTYFTRFTHFTRFSAFTPFTRLTPFTRFTRFTLFTRFTRFTPFTRFTEFTRFTRFVPFDPGDPGPLAGRGPGGELFLRLGSALFALDDLRLERRPEFAAVAPALGRIGLAHLHDLASVDGESLARALATDAVTAQELIDHANGVLRELAR